jgi:hypothetical protein
MHNSERGSGTVSWARVVHLSEGHPGYENYQKMSQKMMKTGGHTLRDWEVGLMLTKVSLRKRKERMGNKRKQTQAKERKVNESKETRSKQKERKQAKAETKTKKIVECLDTAS